MKKFTQLRQEILLMLNRLSTWLRCTSTQLFQIYAVRARREQKTVFIYGFCLCCWVFLYLGCNDFLTPILDLDQMKEAHGVIAGVQVRARHSACGDTVTVNTLTGLIESYYFFSTPIEYNFLENNVGKEVIVWSQPKTTLFTTCDEIYQLKVGEEIIRDYRKIKPRRLKAKEYDPYVIGVSAGSSFLLLVYIYLRFRGDDKS